MQVCIHREYASRVTNRIYMLMLHATTRVMLHAPTRYASLVGYIWTRFRKSYDHSDSSNHDKLILTPFIFVLIGTMVKWYVDELRWCTIVVIWCFLIILGSTIRFRNDFFAISWFIWSNKRHSFDTCRDFFRKKIFKKI